MKKICFIAVLLLVGCSADKTELIEDCEKEAGITPFCQFQNPEDMVLLPDGKTLLISQMGDMFGKTPGSLVLFDTDTKSHRKIFPPADWEYWGADHWNSNCPGKPGAEFSPHGIDLRLIGTGAPQLLIVNHGGRDSIEFFQLINNDGEYSLAWQGCAVPEQGTFMNDVVGLDDGGFIVSHMFDKRSSTWFGISSGMIKAMLGVKTGYLLEWSPENGFIKVPKSESAFPNGLAVSADQQFIFQNVYGANEVRKINRITGELVKTVEISQPDNMTWDDNGNLLIASHMPVISDLSLCLKNPGETCPAAFEVVVLDSETFEKSVIFSHRGAPMGAGTVAKQVGDQLYIGSYTGDRIIKIPYQAPVF